MYKKKKKCDKFIFLKLINWIQMLFNCILIENLIRIILI
jgi:hypothetical protein